MGEELRAAHEERVVAAVCEGEQELVALLDTTARSVGDPPRQGAELQELLKRRLEAVGAQTDLWEPEPTGTGRSLLLNGHIDAVSADPVDRWTSPPLAAGVDLSSHAALTEAPEELGDDALRGRLLATDDSA